MIASTLTLREILIETLPNFTKAFYTKESFSSHFNYETTQKVIDTAVFLRFNTQKFTNVLIFDLDSFPSFTSKPSLQTIHQHFYQLTGFEPSWTLQTQRGYHIALILDQGLFNSHKNQKIPTSNYLDMLILKKQISTLIHADQTASNKSCAIWRNPLTHTHIYSQKKYTLQELLTHFNIQSKIKIQKIQKSLISNDTALKLSNKKPNKILQAIDKGFFIGNRNNYIFAYGYKLLFEDRTLFSTLESLLLQENQKYSHPLTSKEIININQSILNLSSSMYQKSSLSKRGKLSDILWKLNIHGLSKRRAYAGWHTARQRRKSTLKDITHSMLNFFEKGENLTIENIAKNINKSPKTVQRYQNEYNLFSKLFFLWHKQNLKKLASAKNLKKLASAKNLKKIDIRPFVQVTVLKDLFAQLSPFIPSSRVCFLDKLRKKAYLQDAYPLLA